MKVGLFLGISSPAVGGGFRFQDDIVQALARLETRHNFIIFGNVIKAQNKTLEAKHILFVSPEQQDGSFKRVTGKFVNVFASKFDLQSRTRKWFEYTPTAWLKRIAHEHRIEAMWFVTPVFVDLDIPYIYTVWDLQHRLQPWFPEVSANGEWQGREALFAMAIRRAFAIITGTEIGRVDIMRFYGVPSERVRLVPFPTPRFALDAPQDRDRFVLSKYGIPEGYLFYPSQFWPHKNHISLVLAVDILRKRYGLRIPVVFVGSDFGNLTYVQQVVNRLDLSKQVHFLGFVPQEDMVGLYRNAFALICLTFFGPDNLPPLEAFALGCPVIASNVSGAQEQLGDAALLVDPKDERQIGEAIKRLHDDATLRDTLVSRGIARASKWTADDFVKSVFSIIDEFEPIRRCWAK